MGKRLIDLDDVTHGSIKGPVAKFWWQLDAESKTRLQTKARRHNSELHATISA